MMSPPASKHSNTQLTLDQDDITAQVARVLVEMQRQVPVTQKVQRTVQVPLVQYKRARFVAVVPKGANHDRDPTSIHYFGSIAAPNARTLVLIRRFSSCQ